MNNKHQAYLALSDRYDDLDKNLFEAQQNKYILKSSDKNKVNKPLKGTKFDASSIDRSMRDQTRNIVCHAHHVSFEKKKDSFFGFTNESTPLQTSGINNIFITWLSTCFTRVSLRYHKPRYKLRGNNPIILFLLCNGSLWHILKFSDNIIATQANGSLFLHIETQPTKKMRFHNLQSWLILSQLQNIKFCSS